jgi:hypothetical protein
MFGFPGKPIFHNDKFTEELSITETCRPTNSLSLRERAGERG